MAEIIGTVMLHHSNQIAGKENEEKVCICCPGFPSHVYMQSFELPEHESVFPKHFARNLDNWLKSVFCFKNLEGKRIRVTAELVED